jgi:hypothetical protein
VEEGGSIRVSGTYELCHCDQSRCKPLCDASHALIDFDGSETADAGPTVERQDIYLGGTGICAEPDLSSCMELDPCGNRLTNVKEMVPRTGDTEVRSQVMAMIECCSSV